MKPVNFFAFLICCVFTLSAHSQIKQSAVNPFLEIRVAANLPVLDYGRSYGYGFYAKRGSHAGATYGLNFGRTSLTMSVFHNRNEVGVEAQTTILEQGSWAVTGFFMGPSFGGDVRWFPKLSVKVKLQGGPLLLTFPRLETEQYTHGYHYTITYFSRTGTGLGGSATLSVGYKPAKLTTLYAFIETMKSTVPITINRGGIESAPDGEITFIKSPITYDQPVSYHNIGLGICFDLQ